MKARDDRFSAAAKIEALMDASLYVVRPNVSVERPPSCEATE
jgi:hypothetical protein